METFINDSAANEGGIRILINALGVDMGGALRHLRGFLPALSRHRSRLQYVVLVRDSLPQLLASSARVKVLQLPHATAANWLRRLFYENFTLPRMLRAGGFRGIVSLTNFGPLFPRVPHVLFQRDATFFCRPTDSSLPRGRQIDRFLRRLLANLCMGNATLNVTPTRAMADMITSRCASLNRKRFEVLYHAHDNDEAAGAQADALSERMKHHRGHRLVYPTHAAVHKGFPHLFRMLAAAKRNGLVFTLFTMLDQADDRMLVRELTGMIDELGLSNDVVALGKVPQDQMHVLYENADVMVYPSLCESFGFSMVEAMAAGLPVVAVNTATNQEMCADAALYYDASDPAAAAEVLARALDPERNRELRARSRARGLHFPGTWSRYVQQFEEIVSASLEESIA